MTTWAIDDGDLQLAQGDALEVLRTLPAGVAQTCVTSPPYWGLRDYGTGQWVGGDPDCTHGAGRSNHEHAGETRERGPTGDAFRNSSRYLGQGDATGAACRCGAQRVDRQLGLEPTLDEFVARLVGVMREVRRVLRPDGTLWLNLGDSYNANQGAGFNGQRRQDHANRHTVMPRVGFKAKDLVGIPWRVAFALQADGWYLRADCIWSKPNPMPESVTDRPTKAHEYVFLLAPRARYYYDGEAVREPTSRPTSGNTARVLGTDRQGGPGLGDVAASVPWVNDGRGANLRTVWEFPTQQMPEAHFATFPEALAARCIAAGSSEAGECTACGTAWARQVDVGYANPGNRTTNGPRSLENRDGTQGFAGRLERQVATTGWAARCTCNAGRRPQLVLDPYVGSGTTALVARRMGRRSIGIDLSDDYLQIAARRTAQLSLLAGVP